MATIITGCQKPEDNVVDGAITFFPMAEESFVGDPMPYYDGEKLHVFFLEDLRDGAVGFHPWSKFVTRDFVTYEFSSSLIPVVNELDSPERALGTGSVVQGPDKLYYAFYTAHNSALSPKEVIMRATSSNLDNWEKDRSFSLEASNQLNIDDFRDPYVFWNAEAECYWMLVTTRLNDDGVIKRYTSKDLTTWSDEGVFFNALGDGNLECPSLLSYQGKWYLTYSEQWPTRVVRYLVSESSEGPFTTVDAGIFDGEGFYAGRPVVIKDKLFIVGWIPTKVQHKDIYGFDWGGNLAIHQLLQEKDDGHLRVVPMDIRKKNLSQHKTPTTVSESGGLAIYEEIVGQVVIEGRINYRAGTSQYGFAFGINDGKGKASIIVDTNRHEIMYYNIDADASGAREPQLRMPLKQDYNGSFGFEMVVDGNVLSLYINDEVAFSTRIYCMQGKQWGVFSVGTPIEIENLKISYDDN